MARPLVVDLKGGIGNLLFQYAAGMTIASMSGRRCVYSNRQPGRVASLEAWLGVKLIEASDRDELFAGRAPAGSRTARRIAGRVVRTLDRRATVRLDGDFDELDASAELEHLRRYSGYGQHPSFYNPRLPAVLERLATMLSHDLRPDLSKALVVSLRRGDYVPLGWGLTLDYYRQSLKAIGAAGDEVAAVSDDLLAVDLFASLAIGDGYIPLPRDQGRSGQRDDFLNLAAAGRLIMSNSTFVWWAAALGDYVSTSDSRRVVYPSGWIPNHPDVLAREKWIAVDASWE